MMSNTISDLKAAIGAGLMTNKYMVEMTSPIVTMDANQINILCNSASFPERTIATNEIWKYGRKYVVRSETSYSSQIQLGFVDDDKATLRQFFDAWMKVIDDSGTSALFDLSSYEATASGVLDIVSKLQTDPSSIVQSLLDDDFADSLASYQNSFNVWALNGSGEKVYGYKIQNCFPTSMSSVDFADSDSNKLFEFTVTFSYSEFEPIKNTTLLETVADSLVGNVVDTSLTMEDIFD